MAENDGYAPFNFDLSPDSDQHQIVAPVVGTMVRRSQRIRGHAAPAVPGFSAWEGLSVQMQSVIARGPVPHTADQCGSWVAVVSSARGPETDDPSRVMPLLKFCYLMNHFRAILLNILLVGRLCMT